MPPIGSPEVLNTILRLRVVGRLLIDVVPRHQGVVGGFPLGNGLLHHRQSECLTQWRTARNVRLDRLSGLLNPVLKTHARVRMIHRECMLGDLLLVRTTWWHPRRQPACIAYRPGWFWMKSERACAAA